MSLSLAPPIIRAFEDLLERIGIWAVYTRSDPRFRCQACWNLDTREAKADCGTCFGTGFRVTLERWPVVYTQSLRRAAPGRTELELTGWANENDPYVITRKKDVTRVGDYFYIVEWNQPRDRITRYGGQPVRIVQVLRVINIDPQIAGEVCYYINHTEILTEIARQHSEALLSTPITVSREI